MHLQLDSEYPLNSEYLSEAKTVSYRVNIRKSTVVASNYSFKQSVNLDSLSLLAPAQSQERKFRSLTMRTLERSQGNEFVDGNYLDILKLRPLTPYEAFELHTDTYNFHDIRIAILRCRTAFSEISQVIISNKFFEYFIIAVILVNTFTLALVDPFGNQTEILTKFDLAFLIVYTIEMGLKLLALGIGIGKNGYFRDLWNVLDFVIVLTGWIDYSGTTSVNINSLRTLRILRPLRGISSITGLKVLFSALISSIKQLLASLFLFLIFLMVFAIAGLQLWHGILRNHCIDISTGVDTGVVCGDLSCPDDTECGNTLNNPDYGVMSFDNFLSTYLVVFQCVTLEGWTSVLFGIQKAFSRYAVVYFVILEFIGAYMLVNLTLAVIKGAFTVAMNDERIKHLREIKLEEIVSAADVAKQLNEAVENPRNFNQELSIFSECESIESEMGFFPENLLRKDSSLYMEKSPRLKNNPSLARTITWRTSSRYQRQLSTLHELTIGQSISSHLQRMESSVVISKSLLAALADQSSTKIKAEIIAKGQFKSESIDDVIPKLQGYSLIDKKAFQTHYKFKYRTAKDTLTGIDNIEAQVFENIQNFLNKENLPSFQIFAKESLRTSYRDAFRKLKVYTAEFIQNIRERDNITKNIIGEWSEVSSQPVSRKVLVSLSHMEYNLWSNGARGIWQLITAPVVLLVNSKLFNNFISLIVLANIITLSLNRYPISTDSNDILLILNNIFTIIFAIEMGLKLIGLGLYTYCRDTMNYFDAIVTLMSLVELIFISDSKSAISAFRGVRVFRLLRVVRIVRFFRYIQSMAQIFQVIGRSLSKFIYLAMFLLLLIIIYSLLGMKIFAGKLNSNISRSNFDTFHWSFVAIFQVMTEENWNSLLMNVVQSDVGAASCLFLISWIFIGNYVVLNLFLAILLDAFSENEQEMLENLDECSDEPMLKRRSSIFGNIQDQIHKKREKNIKIHIENLPDQDSDNDFELVHLSAMDPLETLYEGIICERSYKVFSKANPFRILCTKVATSPKFEFVTVFVIILSSIKLIIDTYFLNTTSATSSYVDISITFAFFAEFLIKSLSIGLVFDKNSYLRDWWNIIDFVIIIISVIDFALSSISIKYIKVFRLLRTLRPLRFISHNVSMKIVVKALIESIVAIVNVVVVCLIVWLMFAILGVSLFAGKLYQCENKLLLNEAECILQGFSWNTLHPNYDNIVNAMQTLFILSSLEGWPDIMYQAIDAQDIGLASIRNYNPYVAYYFITFVFIGSFFFLNLFIGVIFDKFNEAKISETSLTAFVLNKDQKMWVEIQKLIVNSKLVIENAHKKDTGANGLVYRFAKSKYFQNFILICIVFNMVQMTLLYEDASVQYLLILEMINLAFTIIFIFEALVKISAFGLKNYFQTNWNRFDFIVALTSSLDLIMTYLLNSSLSLLRIGPQLIRIVKVLRVSRLVRLFKILKPLQNLISIMTYSLPAVMNVLSLLLLVFFIYAVLGVYLFGDVTSTDNIDDYTNFSNFGMAMILLFRCSTGENWYVIMEDLYPTQGQILSNIYFISFITITSFVMFNLFTMVILQNYDDYMSNPDSVLKNFSADYKLVKYAWMIYCKYEFIHFSLLKDVMYELGRELGVPADMDLQKNSRVLASLNLEISPDGTVCFKDFLFAILKRKYTKKLKNDSDSKKILIKEEHLTKKKLKIYREKIQEKSKSKTEMSQVKNSKKFGYTGNCFLEMMAAKTTFKAWRNWTRLKIEKRLDVFASESITPRDFEEDHPGVNTLQYDEEEISFSSSKANSSIH